MSETKVVSDHLEELEKEIGYSFKNKSLLREAVTHSSYANELSRYNIHHNERLEFLGDAVLELVTSEFIFEEHKNMPEGKMSKLRASMVCEPSLAICARQMKLGDYLRLGKGEMQTGGRERESILSDAFEAVIGAIYLDGGFEAAAAHVRAKVLETLKANQLFKDSKTMLQEWSQKEYGEAPVYVLVGETGPAHCKEFEIAIQIQGKTLATATGSSKKSAEQNAAKAALETLEVRG